MNWARVKGFLLLLIAAADIILICFVYQYYSDRQYISDDTAASAVAALEKSGITVDKTLLAVRHDSANTYTYAYKRDDYLYLAATLLLGAEPDGIYLLPDGIRAENADGAAATILNDLSLSFTAPGTDAENCLSCKNKALETTEATEEKKALELMLGLAPGTLDKTPAAKCDCGRVFIEFSQQKDGIVLYGMHCAFAFENGKLIFADGKYFFGQSPTVKNEPFLDRINILFSEQSSGAVGEITAMNLCYTLYENAEESTMTLIPSYKISYADGTQSVINSISGEKY